MTPLHFTPETTMANLACFILGAVFILAAQEVIRRPPLRPPFVRHYIRPSGRRACESYRNWRHRQHQGATR